MLASHPVSRRCIGLLGLECLSWLTGSYRKRVLLKYVLNAESLFACNKQMMGEQSNRIIWIINVILSSLVLFIFHNLCLKGHSSGCCGLTGMCLSLRDVAFEPF